MIDINYNDLCDKILYNFKDKNKPFEIINDAMIFVTAPNTFNFKIKKGFKSDGCTIPVFVRKFLGCKHTPEYIPAAIVHDFILENPGVINFDLELSNSIFKAALLKEGVSPMKAKIMYFGVKIYQGIKNIFTGKFR